jgi:hypothetical protein
MEKKSGGARGNSCGGNEPKHLSVFVKPDFSIKGTAHAGFQKSPPLSMKINKRREQGAQMQKNVEGQTGILPSKKPRDQDKVRGARNRQKFRNSLNQS